MTDHLPTRAITRTNSPQNGAKLGFGVSVEAAPEELMEIQEKAAQAGEQLPTPSMPF